MFELLSMRLLSASEAKVRQMSLSLFSDCRTLTDPTAICGSARRSAQQFWKFRGI